MLDRFYRKGIEMHGFMLLRHGQVCAEGSWAPYRPDVPHTMFSFSKSLTSTAIGFAVQEGILSLDDRLVDIFPEKCPPQPPSCIIPLCMSRALTFSTTLRAPTCSARLSPKRLALASLSS